MHRRPVRRAGLVFAAAALALCAGGAVAEEAFPSKPIRMIVPFAPGGGTDIVGRIVALKMGDLLGQQIVVDNRPGAGSTLGTEIVATAEPDGYTMLLSTISFAFNATYYQSLPFDPIKDFTPVSLVADQPNILVVNPGLPVKSVAELIAYARNNPGKLNYASAGNGTGTQFAAELIKLKTGINMVHVPYKGVGPGLNDLIAGQVELMVSTLASAVPHIKTNRLRALAVTSEKRTPVLPDVPTMQEAGVADYVFTTWYGAQVPAGTPAAAVNTLHRAIVDSENSPDVREHMVKIGYDPVTDTPAEFRRFIKAEIEKWGNVVRTAGLQAR